MKLLVKTNLYYLVILLVVFAGGGILFYKSLASIMDESANEKLHLEKIQVNDFIKKTGSLPSTAFMLGDSLIFRPSTEQVKEYLNDTIIFNSYENELLPYRVFRFAVKIESANYEARIFKPMLESDDLIEVIAWTMFWIVALLLSALFLFNYFILRNAWTPFYSTLERIKSFELSKGKIEFENSGIQEFKQLNNVLEQMTSKIVSDYRNMKEFTENASHETQTPLAIIRSRLEILIQSGNLDEQQMKEIQVIYEAATRLSKLNQALLLLTKIENKQFSGSHPVNITGLIENKLELLDDLISHKKINVQRSMPAELTVNMNLVLADALISNLLSNAIKHNVEGGKIFIETSNDKLKISNSGNPLRHSGDKLFKRFVKENTSSDSLGLGLAIVKQICNSFDFNVRYTFVDSLHEITIEFKK
jgi:signal transduction histidine kinase